MSDKSFMEQALDLADRGLGHVEPNPLVGCVLTANGQVVASGYHQIFGGPHAEAVALEALGDQVADTAYVTLEPCSHHGKTPPCADALIAAGIQRVVIGAADPFPEVAGRGIDRLRQAGVKVEVGVLGETCRQRNAAYFKRIETGRPWVIAKWAMTLDGKIATSNGDSKWISNSACRARVHQLRGRMDAIVVGSGTVLADDPLLTARPAGPRIATRVVFDRRARTPANCQLVRTQNDAPVLIMTAEDAPPAQVARLQGAGAEVHSLPHETFVESALQELAQRHMTNVLVEGGGQVLGALFDAQLVDEVHVFAAPRLVGGETSKSPIAGQGVEQISAGMNLHEPQIEILGDNIYVYGPCKMSHPPSGS